MTMRQQEMMRELVEDIRADRTHLRRARDRTRHRRAQGAFRQPGGDGLSRPGWPSTCSTISIASAKPQSRTARAATPRAAVAQRPDSADETRFFEYQVNVLVDNSGTQRRSGDQRGRADLSQPVRHHRALDRSDWAAAQPISPASSAARFQGAWRLSAASISTTRSSNRACGRRSSAASRPAA